MIINPEGVKMLAWIQEFLAGLDLDKPRVTRIEACPLAIEAIKSVSIERPASHTGLASMLGVPLILDKDLPAGTWRALDQYGEVMSEGNVLPSAGPLDILAGSSRVDLSKVELPVPPLNV